MAPKTVPHQDYRYKGSNSVLSHLRCKVEITLEKSVTFFCTRVCSIQSVSGKSWGMLCLSSNTITSLSSSYKTLKKNQCSSKFLKFFILKFCRLGLLRVIPPSFQLLPLISSDQLTSSTSKTSGTHLASSQLHLLFQSHIF